MIGILRKLRIESISSKYIGYAIGESILIVLGILIALGIGNWSDEREFRQYEKLMLEQISIALKSNRSIIDSAYLPRLEAKEEAIEQLVKFYNSDEVVPDAEIALNIRNMSIDFYFFYDSGAYEALKSSGIERLSNAQLRTNLISFYDGFLPAYRDFIEMVNEDYRATLIENRFKIIVPSVHGNDTDQYGAGGRIIVDNVLQHPSFETMFALQREKALNQRARLNVIIPRLDELIAEVDRELRK